MPREVASPSRRRCPARGLLTRAAFDSQHGLVFHDVDISASGGRKGPAALHAVLGGTAQVLAGKSGRWSTPYGTVAIQAAGQIVRCATAGCSTRVIEALEERSAHHA